MSTFEKIIAPLLSELNLDTSAVKDEHCFIELSNDLRVNIICNWMDSVIFVTNLGVPKNTSSQTLLWALLENNLFCELPQVQISAAANEKKIIIWVQERLSQLDAKSLSDLFDRLMRKAKEIKLLMNGQEPAKCSTARRLLGRIQSSELDSGIPQQGF